MSKRLSEGRDGREKGEHVRRLNATEGLLFAVLQGGSEPRRRREKGSRMRGGDEEEEGDSGNAALAEAAESCSVSLQTGGLPTKQAPR